MDYAAVAKYTTRHTISHMRLIYSRAPIQRRSKALLCRLHKEKPTTIWRSAASSSKWCFACTNLTRNYGQRFSVLLRNSLRMCGKLISALTGEPRHILWDHVVLLSSKKEEDKGSLLFQIFLCSRSCYSSLLRSSLVIARYTNL